MSLIYRNHYGKLFESALAHDQRFNEKNKIGIENALAAIVLDNLNECCMPSIVTISKRLLSHLIPLAQKVEDGKASEQETELLDFLLKPFEPNNPEQELGRLIADKKEEVSKKDLTNWLVKQLSSHEPSTFFTHMRFHIRFMHMLMEKVVPDEIFPRDQKERLQKLYHALKPQSIFDKKANRGRLTQESKKNEALTTTFGTYIDIHDVPMIFRKFIGKRTLPVHSSGKMYIFAIPTTELNKRMLNQDLPMISAGSGAIPFLMCAADYAKLGGDDLMKYHLACLANLIGGGHHSLSECISVSQYYIQFKGKNIESLIPASLANHPAFAELIKLTNLPEYRDLWVTLPKGLNDTFKFSP